MPGRPPPPALPVRIDWDAPRERSSLASLVSPFGTRTPNPALLSPTSPPTGSAAAPGTAAAAAPGDVTGPVSPAPRPDAGTSAAAAAADRRRFLSPLSATSAATATTTSAATLTATRPAPPPPAVAAPLAAAAAPPTDDPLLLFLPGRERSLVGIAGRAFLLGAVFALSVCGVALGLAWGLPGLWRPAFFGAALAVFHTLEFLTTARFNTPAAGVEAFLLTANWPAYAIAHLAALLECIVTQLVLFPRSWKAPPALSAAWVGFGLCLVVVGQIIRSLAMCHAGQSFNHQLQRRRASSHRLVTDGVYAFFRHPSYFGFFWWAVGTQVVLGNVICLVGYAFVLSTFFARRIRTEEKLLVEFFGDRYMAYRRRVSTNLPFIS